MTEFEEKQCEILATHFPFYLDDVRRIFIKEGKSFDATALLLSGRLPWKPNPMDKDILDTKGSNEDRLD